MYLVCKKLTYVRAQTQRGLATEQIKIGQFLYLVRQ